MPSHSNSIYIYIDIYIYILILTKFCIDHNYHIYPPVIKHGLLENPPFVVDFPIDPSMDVQLPRLKKLERRNTFRAHHGDLQTYHFLVWVII